MKSRQTIHQKQEASYGEDNTKDAKNQANRARQREAVVKLALRKGNAHACKTYGEALSNLKRWRKRYDGTWEALRDKSHKPLSPHPNQQTKEEETLIRKAFKENFFRWGWQGVFEELVKKYKYERSYWGMRKAAMRMKLTGESPPPKPPRKKYRKFPQLQTPGEKVQIDVKQVPYHCLKGAAKRDEKRLYQWTAIDECTRFRFVYAYDQHTPENSCDFFRRLQKAFPFPIQRVQTDNGTEFTYRFLEGDKRSAFEKLLDTQGVVHKLIAPRTPWHNGKVERSHRSDQRYFYDWEKFGSLEDLNEKLAHHLDWFNNRPMAVLGFQSPAQRLASFAPACCAGSSLRSSPAQHAG
jgi:transposase InsO family protein